MQTEKCPASNAASLPLYSVRAIRGFSAFFSAVAGGVLMVQNLKNVGQPAAARTAFWGSIGYTVLVLVMASFLPGSRGSSVIGVITGIAGAQGLEVYAKKFIENRDDFPTKKIGKPLLICSLIFVPLTILVIYSMISVTSA